MENEEFRPIKIFSRKGFPPDYLYETSILKEEVQPSLQFFCEAPNIVLN